MIRKMTKEDISDVMNIEKEAFADPWDEKFLLWELEENPLARYFVAEEEGSISGYVGVWITFDSSTITNLAVRSDQRRKGLGQALLEKAIKTAEEEGCEFLTLEVRVSNAPAIALYKKNDFDIINVKEAYYQDNYEDAYYMIRILKVEEDEGSVDFGN